MRWKTLGIATAAVALAAASATQAAYASPREPFVGPLNTVSSIASTVPSNGDVNPYGMAVVPDSRGLLHKGDTLVSNFNDSANLQGTGTTIVEVSPQGTVTTFAQIDAAHLPGPCPGGVGLTTALAVFRSGWVVVGSLPTSDGTSATAKAGCLIVLDSQGKVRETVSGHGINGPWDLTALDYGGRADLFVTNVLNGTVAASPATVQNGTVLRIGLAFGYGVPAVTGITTVGSGFAERTDPAALVVGPTGVGLGEDGQLYVADSVGNRITVIPDAVDRRTSAGTGHVVSSGGHLNTPLGLAVAPGGDVLTVNAGDGNLVETTPAGTQVAVRALDTTPVPGSSAGAGALFGLVVRPGAPGVYFVDDDTNTFELLH